MLVLRRKAGQSVVIRHTSGDTLTVKVSEFMGSKRPSVDLVFDDAPQCFSIERPERLRVVGTGHPPLR